MCETNAFNTDIGKRIRQLREGQGKTREQLSEAAGISAQFLFYIETGRKSMSAMIEIYLRVSMSVHTCGLLMPCCVFDEVRAGQPPPVCGLPMLAGRVSVRPQYLH